MLRSSVATTQLFRGLIDNAFVGMIALEKSDNEFRVVFANPHALETLEISSGSDSEKNFRIESLFPSPEKIGAYLGFDLDMLNREGLNSEVMMRKLNDHHFLASIGIRHILVEGKSVVLFSFRDVTVERKMAREIQMKQSEIERAYSELLEQNGQLRQLDLAKDRFIALTTHELRTPLSAILATSDVLELKLYESEEQKEEFIRTISEQGRHLLALVNDVLDFAKIRAGKMEFYVEHIDLRRLISELSGNFGHMAAADLISIEVLPKHELEAAMEPKAWADLLRLKEIVNNVLSNAIKYNRKGGQVKVGLSRVTGEDGTEFARITVGDTGPGIAADKLESVFNEFETVENLARHHKGTGLGMPISRRLVESMGGRLTVTSVVGEGSEFYIDLPVNQILPENFYRSRPDLESDLAA